MFVTVISAHAQTHELHIITADDSFPGQQFSFSMAADLRLIAVGARFDSANGTDAGAAYLFDALSAIQFRKLLPNDGATGDEFGHAIDIDNGIVTVGAPRAEVGGVASGAVYLFDASTGAQLFRLTAGDGAEGDMFGSAVAVTDGVVAVGAKFDDDRGDNSGSVYLFDTSSGMQIDKLTAGDGAANDNFGESVALDGDMLAVGAHGHSHNGLLLSPGAAYLFDVTTGVETSELGASDASSFDFFGSALDIDQGKVIVGAWAKSIVFDHSGAAYIFDATTGEQIGPRLTPGDARDRQNFGISVAIRGNTALIGADGDIQSGFEAGAAYLFDATDGSELDKLVASDGANFNKLGAAAAMGEDFVAVGAIGYENDSGRIYLFAGPNLIYINSFEGE